MEQFSLEKYLANPSRKVVTRSGHSVRIICTDRKAFQAEPSRKVIGLVDMSYCEEAKIWYEKVDILPPLKRVGFLDTSV